MRKIYLLEDVEITYSYVDNPFNREYKNKEFKGLELGKDPRVTSKTIECFGGIKSSSHGGHGRERNERSFRFKNNEDFALEPYIYKGTGWRKISLPNLSEELIPGIYIGYLKSNLKENNDYFKNIGPWQCDFPNTQVKYFPIYVPREGYTGGIKKDSRFYLGQENLMEKLENSIH